MKHLVLVVAAVAALAACNAQDSNKGTAKQIAAGTEQAPAAVVPDPAGLTLTCDYPVKLGMTVAEVLREFGKDAKRGDFRLPDEGPFFENERIVLWDGSDRALYLDYSRGANPVVFQVTATRPGIWQVAGAKLGDPVPRMTEINGKPFVLSGSQAGETSNTGLRYVVDWKGGKLAPSDGCDRFVTFSPADEAPQQSFDDTDEHSSDDPVIRDYLLRVEMIRVSRVASD